MGGNDIWIVDDDQSLRWVLEQAFLKAGMNPTGFESAQGALDALGAHGDESPDAVIADIRMPNMDGFEFLREVRSRDPELPVVIMTAHSDLENAIDSYKGGAFEYLPKPLDLDEVIEVARRACARGRDSDDDGARAPTSEIIGATPAMQEVFKIVGRAARSDITVLITGESGTGKELIARALHQHSSRSDKPFVAINSSAIPHDLLESELFGYEKGAFTGAQARHPGRFEQADTGILFLDEIGDMPVTLQSKLLRVLEDGSFYRIGGRTSIKVDVRIICATHRNLEQWVADGLFREDLWHRLNVIRIEMPPLSERRDDIPSLVAHFMTDAAKQLGADEKTVTPEVMAYLQGLPWKGNVRQVRNVCTWLTVMTVGQAVQMQDLPKELTAAARNPQDEAEWTKELAAWAEERLSQPGAAAVLDELRPMFERTLLKAALRKTGGKRREAATLLGWGRNTITKKMQELGVD